MYGQQQFVMSTMVDLLSQRSSVPVSICAPGSFARGCVIGVALAYAQLEYYGKISIPYLRGAYLYAIVSGQDRCKFQLSNV